MVSSLLYSFEEWTLHLHRIRFDLMRIKREVAASCSAGINIAMTVNAIINIIMNNLLLKCLLTISLMPISHPFTQTCQTMTELVHITKEFNYLLQMDFSFILGSRFSTLSLFFLFSKIGWGDNYSKSAIIP